MKGLDTDIQHFNQLYTYLKNVGSEELMEWAYRAEANNPWFTAENVKLALEGICTLLEPKAIETFISSYRPKLENPKKVGVIMAGNIPAVGFHDFLCVLLSGNILYAKLSSDDTFLIKKLAEILIEFNPALQERIFFVDQLKHMDAYITTGSDNSAKHFEYYFRNTPHIIRKNRTSVAVLNGNESNEQLLALGEDVFRYFGLGCRNISHLYLPKGYSPVTILAAWEEQFYNTRNHHKYMNNYEYNKALLLIDQVPHFDSGYLLLKESESIFSNIATLTYSFYEDKAQVEKTLQQYTGQLQCVVSQIPLKEQSVVAFGMTQQPAITDFADGVDTMAFLTNL